MTTPLIVQPGIGDTVVGGTGLSVHPARSENTETSTETKRDKELLWVQGPLRFAKPLSGSPRSFSCDHLSPPSAHTCFPPAAPPVLPNPGQASLSPG